jgi:tRNA(Ile)-lysidine synthase
MPRVASLCSVEEEFEASIEALWPGETPRRAAVAVSGGADSVALLALCAGSSLFETAVCAHFNHGLRGEESDEDERFVRNLAEEHQLPFRSDRWRPIGREELPRPDRNRQAAARKARYEFLAQVAREEECGAILTAHHARDQVETILQNLARGGGTGAWEGIRASLDLNGVRILRPLLPLFPEALLECLDRSGKGYREDSSNRNPRYRRNWIRAELLPKLASAFPAFEEETIARCRAYRSEAERWAEYAVKIRERGLDRGAELMIRREDLSNLAPEARFLCLQELLRGFSAGASASGWAPTRRKPVEKFFAMLNGSGEGEIELPGGIKASATRSTVVFTRLSP